MSNRADHREERERLRIERTGKHLREQLVRGGEHITQTEAEDRIRAARKLGREKRGES